MKSDSYRIIQENLQKSEQGIANAKRKIFEISLRPLYDSIRRLEAQVSIESVLNDRSEKVWALRKKVADLKVLISQKNMTFTTDEIADSFLKDSSLNK